MVRRVAMAAATVLVASAVSAQTTRVEVRVDVGAQARPKAFSDSVTAPVYQEDERVSTQYPYASRTFSEVAGRVRMWKQLTVGVGFSRFATRANASVQASVPHPFFDHQFRDVSGTVLARRQEAGVDVGVGWLIPLSPRVHAAVSVGPAFLQVKQSLVTGVTVVEVYPFDTAAFASASVSDVSRGATGVYAAADATWLFSKHIGVGALLQFTRATARMPSGDHTVALQAGGVQGGGGIRLVF